MVKKTALLKVFLNSFFIQSAWNFEKMQGLGFAAALSPAIHDIYKNEDEACAALKRHMSFYNAHPYMASPILGAVIRMEEEVKEGRRNEKDISSFKESLMGPYGAIGDTFFWGSVRPLASIIGILSVLLWGLWGPVVFLFVYNLFHLWMRWFGLYKGYKLGEDVVEYIKSMKLPEWALKIRSLATGLLGVLIGVIIVKAVEMGMFEIYQFILMSIIFVSLMLLLSRLLRKGILHVSLAIYLLFLPFFVFFVVGDILHRLVR